MRKSSNCQIYGSQLAELNNKGEKSRAKEPYVWVEAERKGSELAGAAALTSASGRKAKHFFFSFFNSKMTHYCFLTPSFNFLGGTNENRWSLIKTKKFL